MQVVASIGYIVLIATLVIVTSFAGGRRRHRPWSNRHGVFVSVRRVA